MQNKILTISAIFISSLAFSQSDSTSTTVQNDSIGKVEQAPKQRRDTRPLKQRISFGLGTGFWVTPSQTYFELAPMLAYRFPKALIAGVGYRYIYRKSRISSYDLTSHGPNVFARLKVTKRIYLWSEYEVLQSQYVANDDSRQKDVVDSWFVGVGYVRQVGRKGGISMQVLYNVLYDQNQRSPYYSALTYRIGYFF